MGRVGWLLGLAVLTVSTTGCRCFPGFNCYADVIDELHDHQILWDQWYVPRLDISRAGRPDWCGPINRRLAPCRCNHCQGSWKRADECWRYPSHYPYTYPAQTLPIGVDEIAVPAAPPTETGPTPPATPYEEPVQELPPPPPPEALQ